MHRSTRTRARGDVCTPRWRKLEPFMLLGLLTIWAAQFAYDTTAGWLIIAAFWSGALHAKYSP